MKKIGFTRRRGGAEAPAFTHSIRQSRNAYLTGSAGSTPKLATSAPPRLRANQPFVLGAA